LHTLSTHKFSILWLREYVFNQGFSLRYHGAIRSAEGAGGAPPGHGRTNGLRKERYTQRLKGKRVGAAGRALTREGGLQTSGPAPTAGPRQPTQPPAASFRATTVVDGHTTSSGGWRWTDPVCARRAGAIGRDGDSHDDATNSRGRPNESCRSRREQSPAKTRRATPTSSVTLEHSLQATNLRCAAPNSRHV
jgi:hypothetical protein